MAGLYERLLGADWNAVHEAVRQFHAELPLRVASSFRIRHGTGLLARALIRVLRMPPAGEAVPTQLVVTERGETEEWSRTFGGQRLVSIQSAGRADLLVERFGATELTFRLQASDGALVYRHTGTGLRLGPLAFPLPSWLVPQVAAREEPADSSERVRVLVRVSFPLAGLLVLYEGTVASKGAPP